MISIALFSLVASFVICDCSIELLTSRASKIEEDRSVFKFGLPSHVFALKKSVRRFLYFYITSRDQVYAALTPTSIVAYANVGVGEHPTLQRYIPCYQFIPS